MPFYIKNRYADFTLDYCGNPDDPFFETFKIFSNRELQKSDPTFTQRLLGRKDETTLKDLDLTS